MTAAFIAGTRNPRGAAKRRRAVSSVASHYYERFLRPRLARLTRPESTIYVKGDR